MPLTGEVIETKRVRAKHPTGIAHQINNTEGWYQNVQFGGSVIPLLKLDKDLVFPANFTICNPSIICPGTVNIFEMGVFKPDVALIRKVADSKHDRHMQLSWNRDTGFPK